MSNSFACPGRPPRDAAIGVYVGGIVRFTFESGAFDASASGGDVGVIDDTGFDYMEAFITSGWSGTLNGVSATGGIIFLEDFQGTAFNGVGLDAAPPDVSALETAVLGLEFGSVDRTLTGTITSLELDGTGGGGGGGGGDSDGDGVPDADDVCPGGTVTNWTPVDYRATQYHLVNGGFLSELPNTSVYSLTDMGGCDPLQIIEMAGLGQGQLRFGLSKGSVLDWFVSVNS